MSWLQLKCCVHADEAEQLADLLSDLGAASVTFLDAADQPLFEPLPGETPLWDQTLVIGLFSAEADTEALLGQLQQHWGDSPLPACRWEGLEDQDWERVWLKHFRPMSFGQGLWIIPSGYAAVDPTAVNIHLDPGLAFGTGTHPTTAMCLRWLERHPPQGQTVIDYGCGSGILAVAAARLGAAQVIATDIDPQALLATHDNARQNGVADNIQTCLPPAMPTICADLLLANILAGPLQQLASHFARHTRSGGELVLAGLLAEQADTLMAHYARWFAMDIDQQVEQWVCLHGIRLDTPAMAQV
ncbi:MAG: 50S ribosomal protein L11 methyltransferase [Gammaproteobacteria bacterium]